MSSEVTEVPSFEFSAFYYPQLLEALLVYKRINVPELTDESDEEVSIQLLRAIALVGHLNNVTIDIVANESTLPTAQLPETVRNMLRLIDYELKPATPAATDIVYRLARPFTSPFQLVPAEGQVATRRDGAEPVIYFEALAGVLIDRTDQLGACFLETVPNLTYVDRTAAANAGTALSYNVPIGGAIYFGHASVMWDKINFVISAPAPFTIGVWEFYDGDTSATRPNAVALGFGALTFDLTTLLGTSNRAGATVRIRYNTSTTFEDVVSTWDGVKNVATTSLLGQSSPSSTPSDYTVGANWKELDSVVDGTAILDNTGDLSFLLPQTLERNWQKTTVNGFTGFFIRFRVVSGTTIGPTIGRIRIDTGKQYAIARATQGRTVSAETLGSSNGTQNQRFATSQNGFVLGSQELRVDGQTWTLVADFLSSGPGDKHYRIELSDKDVANIVFGDGVAGFIPSIGQGNIVIDYRWGASDNGNVGAQTLVVDKQGLTYVEALYNPRAASGWSEAEANSAASLAKAKVAGPASLRIKGVALSPDDLVTLAQSFVDSSGSKPFGRAFTIEESFGPKTVELVCVGRGGALVNNAQLIELSAYFNGDKYSSPPKAKHFVANQQVVSTNYTPHPVNITATVYAPDSIVAAQIQNQLASVLQPEALNDDGVTYTWEFGADIPVSRIIHEIFRTDASITKVNLVSPAVDEAMGARELPTAGTFSITMVPTN
jgi:hypothetical protein